MNSEDILVRDLSEADIPFILNYWFHSPTGFIESIGVDPAKLPSESDMKAALIEKCRLNHGLAQSKLNALIIVYNNKPVGFHTLFPIEEGDYGIFHAHIWDPAMRRRGIAKISYRLACNIFLKRFNLQRILFKTPKQNIGAIRVKEQLGIRYIGEENVSFGIVRDGTPAKVFEIRKDELEAL